MFLIIAGIHSLSAQSVNWSDDIAAIIYDNCSSCHHEGTAAPFSLMSYEDAVEWSLDIEDQVLSGHMPPWPADPDYRHFKDESVLSDAEIQNIAEWVENNTPSGDLAAAPLPPVFPDNGTMLSEINYTVSMEPYTLQTDVDEYRWFTVENPFSDTIYIQAMEILPGLRDHVHHCDISWDLSGISQGYDDADPLPGFNSETGYPNYDYYMNAWMAGGNIIRYPENWGIEVPPGAVYVLEIHYGPDAIGETDSTKINFQFVADPENVRPVYASWFLNGPETGSLIIPANQIKTFEQDYKTTSKKSFITICPHMHLLGQSYRVWFDDDGDSIPLINIPEWDFHWQKYYTFQKVQVIPSGSHIKAVATYNNTVYNINNPNDPPLTVYEGPTTHDEMLMTYFLWTNYKTGDENIILDSTILYEGINDVGSSDHFSIYPNPVRDYFYLQSETDFESIIVSDIIGESILFIEKRPGQVTRIDTVTLNPGIYIVTIKTNDGLYSRKIIRI